MRDTDTGIYITDDEAVALGVRAGTPWPSATPTIDPRDVDELQQAAERGTRSLLARGLLGADGTDTLDESLQSLIGPVLRGQLQTALYATDSAKSYLASGVAALSYVAEESHWVAEMIGPGGIHRLSEEDPTTTDHRVREIVTHCFDEGPADMAPGSQGEIPEFVCAMRRRGGSIRSVVVRHQEVYAHLVGAGADSIDTDSQSLTWALEQLGLHGGSG